MLKQEKGLQDSTDRIPWNLNTHPGQHAGSQREARGEEHLCFMPGNVSTAVGLLSVTAVRPYGAAFTGISRTEAAKNGMCYFGP